MATNEAQFQTEILDACHERRWHAFKVAQMFSAGTPDLYIKRPNHPGLWVELKYEAYRPAMEEKGVHVNLTTLQRKFLRMHQNSGGHAGWLICVGTTRRWFAFVGTDHDIDLVHWHPIQTREVGQPWQIEHILTEIG